MELQITYTEYMSIMESIENEGLYTEVTLPRFMLKIKDFINTLIASVKDTSIDVIKLFKDKYVYKFFKACKFSIAKIHKLLEDGYKTAKRLKMEVGIFIQHGVHSRTAEKFDVWLDNHKWINKLTGVAVAGLLVYIWFNMSFTGDMEYDMNMGDMLGALKGNFSMEGLFAGENGVKLLSLFAAGKMGMSFPWGGSSTNQFIASVVITVASAIGLKMKRNIHKKLYEASALESLLSEYRQQIINELV